MSRNNKGVLMIMAGPSGVGKGTVLGYLREMGHDFFLSVSATTRAPRPGEVENGSYIFLDKAEFEDRIARHAFLEHARYLDEYYGTPEEPVEAGLAEGRDCILEIDVQGAFQVKEKRPDAIMVFMLPPSMEELEKRLRGRGTETEDKINRRIARAADECAQADRFTYRVTNLDAHNAARELHDILCLEREKHQAE